MEGSTSNISNGGRVSTSDSRDNSKQTPLIVTMTGSLWMGLGSVGVCLVAVLMIGVYCLGRQHGRTDERLIFLEGLAAGETYMFNFINDEVMEKWQLKRDVQKALEEKRKRKEANVKNNV